MSLLTSKAARSIPLCFYGIFFLLAGVATYLLGVFMAIPRNLLGLNGEWLRFNEIVVWYSGVPIVLAGALAAIDFFILLPYKRRTGSLEIRPLDNPKVTVVLTAYNDEQSIGLAVRDFRGHPAVKRVIVVDNNSRDRTAEVARAEGAQVIVEQNAGYGHCVYRCLSEGATFDDTPLVVLCEGDMTFRSKDIDKLVAYAPHADIVNGTRIVEQLRERQTQLTTFIYYGNFFVGKLLEAKHLGKGTFTDVGTTYKLCWSSALRRLLPVLNPKINLTFNAYFLDTALANDFSIVECPITFFVRVGASKGGNTNNGRAFKVGMQMITGLLFGWRANKS
jgi:glycosyltransferase involved in cell wall biosynthesis